ncbi:hypothetical protein GLOIN_2v1842132 [Rhizophagus irregularis DAOM 181602=DAOM 197198]|nr:hypothetical protein GLOIN_2v1842132 [Rhizophagus irregularis DAOM 181602=DAOM 197198]
MTLRPFYNLVQLGLDEYEDNELQKDLRTCYEKVGFKHFFERYIELKSLDKKELEYRYCYNQGCGSTRVSRMG